MAVESILTPFPHDSSSCILGPFRESPTTDDSDPRYLNQALGFAPPLLSASVPLDRPPTIRTWPWSNESDNHNEWRKWSYRVEKTFGDQWKRTFLYDLINFCRHGLTLDANLLGAACCFWSTHVNAFCFPDGPMSPTILDISAITGLPAFGDDITPQISFPTAAQYKVSRSKDKTYGVFVSTYMGADNSTVTQEEHTRFLTLWLCRYIFCSRSIQVTHEYVNLAIALANGQIMGFSAALLAFLYRCLYEFVVDNSSSPFGPLWLLQIWLYLYFIDLRPKDHRLEELTHTPLCCCFISVQTDGSNFQTYFEYFYLNVGKPCWTAVIEHLPDRPWFAICQDSGDDFGTKEKNLRRVTWASCLVTRDLVVGFCPIEGFHKKAKLYCELYAANLCARQFGLIQGIPVFYVQSRNFMFPHRQALSFPHEMTMHLSAQTSREAAFVYEPFSLTPDTTPAFLSWWEPIRTELFKRSLSTLLGLFSLVPITSIEGPSAASPVIKRRLSPGPDLATEEETSSSDTYGSSRVKPLRKSARRAAMGAKNSPPMKSRNSQEQPIELDDEPKDSAAQLLDQRKSPLSSYSAGTSDVGPLIASSPFLQVNTPSTPIVTAKAPVGSPNFSLLRQQLSSLSGGASFASSSPAAQTQPMTVTTTLSTLRSLATCTADEAFGDKAGLLRTSLICLIGGEDIVPQVEKDILQSSLQRLEGNCSALRTHKPIVEQYKTLRNSIDTYNVSVMSLIDQIDNLETEYNSLTAAAKLLQEQLDNNVNRQTEIGNEQATLQTRSQQLINDHQANSKALISCQNAYDFSLPVWNAVLLSWENMKDLICRLPNLPPEAAAVPSQPGGAPPAT